MKDGRGNNKPEQEALDNIDYEAFTESVGKIANWLAKKFTVKLHLNVRVLDECYELATQTLNSFRQPKYPSAGKIAASQCYWVKKLKPFSLTKETTGENLVVNETCAVLLALSILNKSNTNPEFISDLAGTLRIHSHSPHSLALVFEALEGRGNEDYKEKITEENFK